MILLFRSAFEIEKRLFDNIYLDQVTQIETDII